MEQTKESTTETEAECQRRLWLEHKGCVVELELLKRSAKLFVLVCLYRVKSGKDHRFYLLETCNSLSTRVCKMGDGVTDLHLDC